MRTILLVSLFAFAAAMFLSSSVDGLSPSWERYDNVTHNDRFILGNEDRIYDHFYVHFDEPVDGYELWINGSILFENRHFSGGKKALGPESIKCHPILGNHTFDIWMKLESGNGTEVHDLNLSMYVQIAFNITCYVPDPVVEDDRTIFVHIICHYELFNVTVYLDTDYEMLLDRHYYNISKMEPGEYLFTSNVTRSSLEGPEYNYLGIQFYGYYSNDELFSVIDHTNDIDVRIKKDHDSEHSHGILSIGILAIVLILIVVLGISSYGKKRKRD